VLGAVIALVLRARAKRIRAWKVRDAEEGRADTAQAVRDTLDRLVPVITKEIALAAVPMAGDMASGVIDAGEEILDTADEILDDITDDIPGGGVVNQILGRGAHARTPRHPGGHDSPETRFVRRLGVRTVSLDYSSFDTHVLGGHELGVELAGGLRNLWATRVPGLLNDRRYRGAIIRVVLDVGVVVCAIQFPLGGTRLRPDGCWSLPDRSHCRGISRLGRCCVGEGVVVALERLPALARRQLEGDAAPAVDDDDPEGAFDAVPDEEDVEAVAGPVRELLGGVVGVHACKDTAHALSFPNTTGQGPPLLLGRCSPDQPTRVTTAVIA
jgi:hypothetical protein